MDDKRYVALLRAINVGGNNIIKMVDLRESFETMGFSGVATYIQSGNVVFSSKLADKAKLISTIEKTLDGRFSYASRVVLVSASELDAVVNQAPARFGKQPDQYRYDVLFLKEPLTSAEAIELISTKPGVDQTYTGQHVLYFRRLISKAEESHLSKLVRMPIFKSITIRNWNTTTKLLAMVTG